MLVVSPQKLGQHFLADAGWRARIAQCIGAGAEPAGRTPSDAVWLEIGAGHGEMTRELAPGAARVVAVEVDPRLADHLRGLARELPNVVVVAGDVLALDLDQLLPGRVCRVYGNLPYYITSPILRRLFEHADRDRKSTRLNSSHIQKSRMPSSA